MERLNKKLTAEQKKKKREHKAEQQRLYEWVMINGKQKKIRRTPEYNPFSGCESWADYGVEMEILKMEQFFGENPDAEEFDPDWESDSLPF